MTSCWVLWGFLCLGAKASHSADCLRAELVWHCEALEYHVSCWLGLGKSQQTCWACSAIAGLCPAGGSSCAEWLWLCKPASWLLSEHPALPFSKWRSSWTSMFLSGYCSLTVRKNYLKSQRARHFELFSPHWCFCFLLCWIEDVKLGVKTCISGSVKVRKSVCLQSGSQPCADCVYSI